jgi:AcrR family transcriptional regulator
LSAVSSARPSQRAAQKQATRRRILAAARALFRARGIGDVAIDDIAIAAGVGRATIYLHYSGKPAILVDLLVEDWDRQAHLFERLASAPRIDAQAVADWLRRLVDGMQGARDSFALHRFALSLDDEMAARHRAHRRRLAEILAHRFRALAGVTPRQRARRALMVAELEYLGTASVTEWGEEETAAAIILMAERMLDAVA